MKKIFMSFGIFLLQIIFFTNTAAQSNNFNVENYKLFLQSHRNISSGSLLQLYDAGKFASNIHMNDSSAVYFDSIDAKYNLTSYEKSLLQQNGFVISERLNGSSFGGAFMQIFQQDLPVFISTDAILYALHMSYDNILKDVELSVILERRGRDSTALSKSLEIRLNLHYLLR